MRNQPQISLVSLREPADMTSFVRQRPPVPSAPQPPCLHIYSGQVGGGTIIVDCTPSQAFPEVTSLSLPTALWGIFPYPKIKEPA